MLPKFAVFAPQRRVRHVETIVVAEGIALPLDEGGTISAAKMIEELPGPVLLLNRTDGVTPCGLAHVRQLPAGRSRLEKILRYVSFIAVTVWSVIRYRPAHVFYFPLCEPSIPLQLHARALALLAPNFTEVLFQVGRPSRIFALVSKFRIQVVSPVDQQMLAMAGIAAEYVPPRFKRRAARKYDKVALRQNYGIPVNAFVVTHIGHPNAFRGLDIIASAAERNTSMTFLVVLSSRLPLRDLVFPSNVMVLNEYIPDVHEIYALSDVYFFPLRSDKGAISTPLTLLEATEAELPIVCSNLPKLCAALEFYDKVAFVENGTPDTAAAFADCLEDVRSRINART